MAMVLKDNSNYEDNLYLKEFRDKYFKKVYESYESLYKEGLEFYSFEIRHFGKIKGEDKSYVSGAISAQKMLKQQIKLTLEYFLSKIPYVENVYMTINYSKKESDELAGYPHIKGIIGISTILGGIGNDMLLSIKKLSSNLDLVAFLLNMEHTFEVKVDYLSNMDNISKGLIPIVKNYIFKNHYICWFKSKNSSAVKYEYVRKQWGDFLEHEVCIVDGISFFSERDELQDILKFKPIKIFDRETIETYPIVNRSRDLKESGVISLINSYMIAKNYYYSKGKIYLKWNENSYVYKYEFETFLMNLLGILEELLKDDLVLFQLQYFDSNDFFYKYINTVVVKLRNYPNLLINSTDRIFLEKK